MCPEQLTIIYKRFIYRDRLCLIDAPGMLLLVGCLPLSLTHHHPFFLRNLD